METLKHIIETITPENTPILTLTNVFFLSKIDTFTWFDSSNTNHFAFSALNVMPHSLKYLSGLRILHVTDRSRKAGWLKNALSEFPDLTLTIQEEFSTFDGLKALQMTLFDAVLVSLRPATSALDFISGCRTGGVTVPMLILGRKNDSNLLTRVCLCGGDGWIPLEETTVSDLLWQLALAVENHRNAEENRELRHRMQQDILLETEETQQFVALHREILAPQTPTPRTDLAQTYQELLKNSILLTAGDTEPTVKTFCNCLIQENTTAPELFRIHLDALEILLQMPGRKNTLHWLNRANILLGKIFANLLEHYQKGVTIPANTFIQFPDFRRES